MLQVGDAEKFPQVVNRRDRNDGGDSGNLSLVTVSVQEMVVNMRVIVVSVYTTDGMTYHSDDDKCTRHSRRCYVW